MIFCLERQKAVRNRGVVLMVIGGVLFIVAILPFLGTSTLLDETHTIDGYFFSFSCVFTAPQQIHISFTVSGGPVDFWVMNENEYNHFKNGEGFNYYTVPSTPSVSSTQIDWSPPLNERIHFVWDNFGSTSKVVSMFISSDYSAPLFPDWARLALGALSGILFLGGLSSFISSRSGASVSAPSPPPPSITREETKFCRYCGARNKIDADFCEKCGREIR